MLAVGFYKETRLQWTQTGAQAGADPVSFADLPPNFSDYISYLFQSIRA
jgi:hypothetical protein